MNSITAYMIIQNEQDIIEQSITNPLLVYDQVVILDGGSTDRTLDVVKDTARNLGMAHKLLIHTRPFTTLNDQRNHIIKLCNTEFLHYIDADEVYTIDHLKKIREQYINEYNCIQIRSIHFYIDFYHRAVGPETWDMSWMMPKVFYNMKGHIEYLGYAPMRGDHSLLVDGKNYQEYWKNSIKLCDETDIVCHHYGHALGRLHEHKKIKWFMTYDNPVNRALSNAALDTKAWESCYFDPRFWDEGINADKKGIVPFRGEHPEIMKKNSLYGVHVITDDINTPNNTVWRQRK